MRLLLLRLEGPLQSWGDHSEWDDRDTTSMPTKSGVIGLIACCMGLVRGDARICAMHNTLTVSVCADSPGQLGVDYQTAKSPRLMTADGKFRSVKKSTIESNRQYLQDASFLVVLASEQEALLDEIAHALRHPKWTPYLGRKCCVPTRPLLEEDSTTYASVEDAIRRHPVAARFDHPNTALRAEIETPNGEYSRNDHLVDARERRFTVRNVRMMSIQKEE